MPSRPSPSVRAFMEGIVDYAGLFPPAGLPLDEALQNYAVYRQSDHAWMLGRFICPAHRLAEVEPFAALFAHGEPWSFSVLGRGGDDADAFVLGIKDDFALIDTFVRRYPNRVTVGAFEVRLPPPVATGADGSDLGQVLRRAAEAIETGATEPVSSFLEIQLDAAWAETLDRVIPAMAAHNRDWHGRVCGPIGAKIRTGGVEAVQFPTIEQVAGWIEKCAGEGVPFKATAGLHHPFRHHDDAVGTRMHGFVNLFLAAVLVRRGRNQVGEAVSARLAALEKILAEEDRAAFDFDSETAGWGDQRATVEQIRGARATGAVSFGSCSFLDPIDDLKTAGLL